MSKKPEIKPEWLDLEFHCDDIGRNVTIRYYLSSLLWQVWNEGEGFSGKRPFGNSGWENDMLPALKEVGVTTSDYHAVVAGLIDLMGKP